MQKLSERSNLKISYDSFGGKIVVYPWQLYVSESLLCTGDRINAIKLAWEIRASLKMAFLLFLFPGVQHTSCRCLTLYSSSVTTGRARKPIQVMYCFIDPYIH